MGLFRKKPIEPTPGRRRPAVDDTQSNRAQAFSYYSQRSARPDAAGRRSDAAELAQRPGSIGAAPWYRRRRTLTLGAVLLAVLAGYNLWLTGNPKVVVMGDELGGFFIQDTTTYGQTAAQEFGKSLLNRNKLTVDSARIAAAVTQQYPEVTDARFSVPLIGNRPTLYLQPSRPSFILTTTDNAAYLLDENGRALISVSQLTGTDISGLPRLQDRSGAKASLGAQVLPASSVAFIERVAAVLEASGGYKSLVLPQTAGELHVYVKNAPYYAKFVLEGDPVQQAGALLAVQGRLSRDKVTPTEYIDVRVAERAYYR